MSYTTHSGIRRSSRLSKKVSTVVDYETSSLSSQASTPRRSKRIAALRVLSDNKNFSQFEQLVDTIVEKKFRFNPVNEIITYNVSPTQSRYPTRYGTRVSYAHYFHNERHTTSTPRYTSSVNHHYNLRSQPRVDYSSF